MVNFWSKLKSSTFARDTAVLTVGTAISQAIAMASMPVLSRIYTPHEFGLFAIFIAIVNITATLITLRYESFIITLKDERQATDLLKLALSLASALGIAFTIIIWITPIRLTQVFRAEALNGWLTGATICATGLAAITSSSAWLNRKAEYAKIAKIKIIQSGLISVSAIVCGYLGLSNGLMASQLFGITIPALLIIFWSISDFQPPASFKKIAHDYKSAPLHLLPTALLDIITQQAPVFLITIWFSSELAGQFSMAWRLLSIPTTLIGAAVGQVFLQRFSLSWPNKKKAKNLFLRSWIILSGTGFIPFLIIFFQGENLFTLLLGAQWGQAGKIAESMAPLLFFIFVSSTTSGAIIVINQQKWSIYFGVSFLFYRIIAFYIGLIFHSITLSILIWTICEFFAIAIYNRIIFRKLTE